MNFAKVADVTSCTQIANDGGFTCIAAGAIVTVLADADGELYFECDAGRHYLDGQLSDDGTYYVGLSRPEVQ